MNLELIFKILKIIIAYGDNPLIIKFVDNVVAKTTTNIDDFIWKVVKMFISGEITLPEVGYKLESAQAVYDSDPAKAKEPATFSIAGLD